MAALLPALLLAAAFDGDAALRHASQLAALGPHTWGSPRTVFAARYVETQFRDAGLQELRLQPFESHGIRGANVIGVLRGAGEEFVVVGAHHDTAPEAPGAYDDGGGVGVMIELARVLAAEKQRRRTLVFVSFDAEESWSTGKLQTAGSRAYVKSLGPQTKNLVAAFIIEMCGWKPGAPMLHPITYADPLRPGASTTAPAWLFRSVYAASREAKTPFGVGDPVIPWLYQAGVRTFRIDSYGDDLSFLQAGLPAVFVSDSSFYAFYPWYHEAGDTADKLDAGALERMGKASLAAVHALESVPRGAASEPHWFAAFGQVLGLPVLWALAVAALLPGARAARGTPGKARVLRLLHAAVFAWLVWRHPVPALFVLALPALAVALPRRAWAIAATLVPGLLLAFLGWLCWKRSFTDSLWLAPWELALVAAALLLSFVGRPGAASPAPAGRLGGKPRKRGLPGR